MSSNLKVSQSRLAYSNIAGRDLRLDLLRGGIMLVVIIVHLEFFSLLSMFAWERIGLVSSAEGFVGLSGIVLGIVYKKRIAQEGFKSSAIKLWKRSFQLYRVNLFIILSITLLEKYSSLDMFNLTHWVPITAKDQVYRLFPLANASWLEIIQQALLLKAGPHQFRVIGLYVLLIALAPLVLFLMQSQKTLWLILCSCLIYVVNYKLELRLTNAGYEWAFPTLTWQLLFINGMVVGYHHQIVLQYLSGNKNRVLVYLSGLICLTFLTIALNNPNAVFWPWRSYAVIDSALYSDIYMDWFAKSTLGIGRVINNIALFVLLYHLLSHYWLPINKLLGWLLIPLGQASLYVFILHIYFILIFSNLSFAASAGFIINTAIHVTTILMIWSMVKLRILFWLIPR